jgi:hypothetical protein
MTIGTIFGREAGQHAAQAALHQGVNHVAA